MSDKDIIYRQAAIDALGEKPLAWTDGEYELALQQQWESDIDAIKAVPSAQPEQCNDCIANGGDWECDHIHCRKGQLPFTQPEILACGEGELNVPDTNVGDTIYRQAAIDAICKACSMEEDYHKCNGYPETSIWCEYLVALRALPSVQPKQRWIPCSERLPEYDGEMYLVTDYCEQINRKRLHVSYCYVNREGFWSDVPMGYKVIAWMPLPEPYVERRTDE